MDRSNQGRYSGLAGTRVAISFRTYNAANLSAQTSSNCHVMLTIHDNVSSSFELPFFLAPKVEISLNVKKPVDVA